MSTAIIFPTVPKEKDYEDYICAFLLASGYYIEKSIILREEAELLELDIITTDFKRDSSQKRLIEIKSGKWGFTDIFKIRGWMTFLKFDQGAFIVQKTEDKIEYKIRKAAELGVGLICNSDFEKTEECLKELLLNNPDPRDVNTIQFAYVMERTMLEGIKVLKRAQPEITGYQKLDNYYFNINCASFFTEDPIERINEIFQNYIENKNISAKLCSEINGGKFEGDALSKACFNATFYKSEENIYQTSLFIEHLSRLTIIKCCIEHLIDRLKGRDPDDNRHDYLRYLVLPESIKNGLNQIIKEPYFHLYPYFWQYFTYVYGGFILMSHEKHELENLSKKTGIPLEEIPNAFDAFNKLFPHDGGWFYDIPYTSIKAHYLFPVAFCGIGANYRAKLYTGGRALENLKEQLPADHTYYDLVKWNNLSYRMLLPYLKDAK